MNINDIIPVAQTVWDFITAHKDAILSIIGGAAGLSVFAQGLLHKLDPHFDGLSDVKRKLYAYALVQMLTAITAISTYLVTNVNLEVLWPTLAATVTFIHRIAVSPVYVTKILPFLEFQANQKVANDASAAESEAEAIPAQAVGFVN